MRALKIFFLFFIFALISLYVSRTLLTEKLAISMLNRSGWEIAALKITSLNADKLVIKTFSGTLPGKYGPTTLQLYDLQVRYRLSDLLQGKVEDLILASIDIDLPASGTMQQGKPSIHTLFDLLGALRLPRLPFHTLNVTRLVLNGENTGPFGGKGLSLNIAAASDSVHFTVKSEYYPAATATGKVELLPGEIDLQITIDQNREAPLTFRLLSRHEEATVLFSADLDQLSSMAGQLLPPPFQDLHGRLEGSVSLLPRENEFYPFTADIQTTFIQVPGLSPSHAGLFLNGLLRDDLQEFILAESSKLATGEINIKSVELAGSTLNLAGRWQKDEHGYHYTTLPVNHAKIEALTVGDVRLQNFSLTPFVIINKKKGEEGKPGVFHLQLTVKQDNEEALLTVEVLKQAEKTTVSFSCDADQLSSIVGPLLPLPLEGKVNGSVSLFPLENNFHPFTVDVQAGQLQFSRLSLSRAGLFLNGRIRNDYQECLFKPDSRLTAEEIKNESLTLAHAALDLAGQWQKKEHGYQYTTLPENQGKIDALTAGNIRIEDLLFTPAITIDKTREGVDILLAPSSALAAQKIHADKFIIAAMKLRPGLESRLHFNQSTSLEWSLSPGSWLVDLTGVNIGTVAIEPSKMTLHIQAIGGSGAKWKLRGALESQEGHITTPHGTLPFQIMTTQLDFNNNEVKGWLQLEPEKIPGNIQVAFQHNLHSGSGRVDVETKKPLTFSSGNAQLSDLITGGSIPIEVHDGDLQLEMNATWARQTSPMVRGTIQLTDGAGKIRDIQFSGLTLEQDIMLLPELRSRKAGHVTVEVIHSRGIEARELKSSVSVQPSRHGQLPLIELTDISAQCFGGTIALQKAAYDLNQPGTQTTLEIQGMDLEQVITTMRIKGLDIEGKVAGTLPLRLTSEGFTAEGSLHHLGTGGSIKYTPPAGSQQNSHLTKLVLDALEEFHYSDLGASVNYHPDGTLLISLQLKGKSPSLKTDRPVHLNITTEQNLLSLLESLRYSTNMTKELERNMPSFAK